MPHNRNTRFDSLRTESLSTSSTQNIFKNKTNSHTSSNSSHKSKFRTKKHTSSYKKKYIQYSSSSFPSLTHSLTNTNTNNTNTNNTNTNNTNTNNTNTNNTNNITNNWSNHIKQAIEDSNTHSTSSLPKAQSYLNGNTLVIHNVSHVKPGWVQLRYDSNNRRIVHEYGTSKEQLLTKQLWEKKCWKQIPPISLVEEQKRRDELNEILGDSSEYWGVKSLLEPDSDSDLDHYGDTSSTCSSEEDLLSLASDP